MSRVLYVNLPVTSLAESERFYLGFGLTKIEEYSNSDATALKIDEHLFLMLLSAPFFETFLPEGDTAHLRSHAKQMLNALQLETRLEVDEWCLLAVTHGGSVYRKATETHGMYSAAIADPDGHVWELMPADFSL